MLSFIREQGAGEPSEGQTKGAGQHEGMTGGDAGAQEYLTVATNSKSLRKSTILVAVLVAIGLVCLWLMIRKSQPQAVSAEQSDGEQVKMEAAIDRLTGVGSEMASKMDQIVSKFYEFSNVFQVQVNELSKNPFETEGFMKDLKDDVAVIDNGEAQAALLRRKRMQQSAASLQLLSVMQSGQANSCMINDQILRQDDTIEGFTITRIGADFVELNWQDDRVSGTATSETEDLKILLKLSQ